MKTSVVLENSLDTKIFTISKQINAKVKQLAGLRSDLDQFLDANFNLKVAVKQDIDKTDLSPGELLAEIERLETMESVRLSKLASVNKACTLFESRINKAENELQQLQKQLTSLNDEKDWQVNYQPRADKYSETFVNDFKEKTDRKIVDSKKQLNSYKQQFEKIEYFLNDPDDRIKQKFCKLSDETLNYEQAERAFNTIPGHIIRLESAIESYQSIFDKWLECLNRNPDYRQFIRARVDIDTAANELKDSADEYLSKLEAFKALKENCNTAIRYTENLGYSNNRIISVTIADYIQVTDMVINV